MASSPNVPIGPMTEKSKKRELTHAEMERVYQLEDLLFRAKDVAESLMLDEIRRDVDKIIEHVQETFFA